MGDTDYYFSLRSFSLHVFQSGLSQDRNFITIVGRVAIPAGGTGFETLSLDAGRLERTVFRGFTGLSTTRRAASASSQDRKNDKTESPYVKA